LNPSITGPSGANRILGLGTGTINNYALAEMLINGLPFSGTQDFNSINGYGIAACAVIKPNVSPYTTLSFNWDFTPNTGVWTFGYDYATQTPYRVEETTNLPILTVFNDTNFPIPGTAIQPPFIVCCVPPSIQTSPSLSAQTSCENSDGGFFLTPLEVIATGTGLTYQWYVKKEPNGVDEEIIGETNYTYTPPNTTPGEYYFYCVVTGTCGTITSGVSGVHTVTPTAETSVIISVE
jgi:hypothetical protein